MIYTACRRNTFFSETPAGSSGRIRLLRLLCLAVFLCLPASPAGSEPMRFVETVRKEPFRIKIPSSVHVGEAIHVSVAVPRTESVTFRWMGKEFTVPVQPGPEDVYAQALLPVPLDEKSPRLVLRVKAPGYTAVERSVTVLRKTRPLQELKVAPAHVEPPAEARARIAAEAKRSKELLARITPRRMWRMPLDRPTSGGISSAFGLRRIFNGQPRSPHKGLDLRGAQGDPVRAPSAGTVVLADDMYFSGKVVYIDHGLGVFSLLAHLSAVHVKEGQEVAKGQVVGNVGSTGRSTGPHLHFACYVLGTPVDPVPLTER